MPEIKTNDPNISLLPQKPAEYYQLAVTDVEKKLETNVKTGLSTEEATRRLKVHGSNVLPSEENEGYLQIFARQVQSPLVYILLFAAFLSLALRRYTDLIIIMSVLAVNVLVGFFQEHRANSTLEELQKVVKNEAVVLRSGVITEVESAQVVPGDIIRLRAGDKVSADARLFSAESLEVNEAALTGESVASLKHAGLLAAPATVADRDNMVFMGTEISAGIGWGIVTATGKTGELGRLALLVQETQKVQTTLQRSLAGFSRWIAWATLALGFFVLTVGIIQHRDFFDMLVIAVAVAVGVIPEGLLISLTTILAVGMQRILGKRGLVRHMSSAETLGATSIICTDKTGTLTLGEMRVVSLVTAAEEFHKKAGTEPITSKNLVGLLSASVLVNEAVVENPEDSPLDWKILGNPTDAALLLAASEVGSKKTELEKTWPLLHFLPFNEKQKYAVALRKFSTRQNIAYIKGAAEIVLRLCRFADLNGQTVAMGHPQTVNLEKRLQAMTADGLRVLAVAWRKTSEKITDLRSPEILEDLVFAGFIGLRDPLRTEVAATLAHTSAAGLRMVMITGDHKLTAVSVARELGISVKPEEVLEGSELEQLNDAQLLERVKSIKIYSRVSPTDKLRIIDAWQKRGEVVAMTGDGVNDAPALKKADIGIALGSATPVAKASSDLVLLDNNFQTIVAAIEQGRIIFNNIRRVILYLLSDSFSSVVLVSGALALDLPLPLLPAQILWSNLVTDGPPNLALTFEPGDSDVMREKPRRRGVPLIDDQMKFLILVVGIISDFIFLALFLKLIDTVSLDLVRTTVFAAFGLSSLFYAFSLKSLKRPIWRIPLFNNHWLVWSVIFGIVAQLAAIYWHPLQTVLHTTALPLYLWGWVAGLSLIKVASIELAKGYFRFRQPR